MLEVNSFESGCWSLWGDSLSEVTHKSWDYNLIFNMNTNYYFNLIKIELRFHIMLEMNWSEPCTGNWFVICNLQSLKFFREWIT